MSKFPQDFLEVGFVYFAISTLQLYHFWLYGGVALQLKERTKNVFVAPRFLVPGLFSFWTTLMFRLL